MIIFKLRILSKGRCFMVIKKGVCKILSCAMAASLISGIAAEKYAVKAIATKNIISSWEHARIDQYATQISAWIEQQTVELLREKKFKDRFAQMDSCAFIMLCYCVYSSRMDCRTQHLSELVDKRTEEEIAADLKFGKNISSLQYRYENITNMISSILGLEVDKEKLTGLGKLLISLRDNRVRKARPKGRRDRYGKWNTGYDAEIREALTGDAYRYDDDE